MCYGLVWYSFIITIVLKKSFHHNLVGLVCKVKVMPRSHIHGLDAALATDTIGIIRGNLYWSVAFRIASVITGSST